MTRSAQAGLLLGVALAATLAGYLLYPFLRAPEVDTQALLATSLPDLQGQRRRIGDWRGKLLVVNFWATWCPPCLEEVPVFIRMQARFGQDGLQFLGVAADREDRVVEFAKAHRMNYPVLIGHAGAIELSRLAGNSGSGLPYTLILDRNARVIRTFSGALTEASLIPVVEAALRR